MKPSPVNAGTHSGRRRLEEKELARQCDGVIAVGEWLRKVGPDLLSRSHKRDEVDGHARSRRLDGNGGHSGEYSDPTPAAALRRIEDGVGSDPVGDAAAVIRRIVPAVVEKLREIEKAVMPVLPPAEWLLCTCPLEGPRCQVQTVENSCMRCGRAVLAKVDNAAPGCVSHLRFGFYVVADAKGGRCRFCRKWQIDHATTEDPPEHEIRQHELRRPGAEKESA